ncbi:uracil-DNA glycosylase family protein [Xylophilus sp. GW821-FHT01B05]
MGLDLDPRQRAMLEEMGVTVWQPLPQPVVAVEAAPPVVAPPPPPPAPAPRPAPPPPPARAPAAAPAPAQPSAGTTVQVGPWQALYPLPDDPALPTWLVLAESPGGELLAGDAGKLLDNMLRAAQLHRSARVFGAVVARDAAALPDGSALAAGLQQAVAEHRPALVLAMGRLPAQSLLQSTEPLGRLRGQAHDWQGVPVLATYDAAYLLRAQADKARAWADLCQALAVVAAS